MTILRTQHNLWPPCFTHLIFFGYCYSLLLWNWLRSGSICLCLQLIIIYWYYYVYGNIMCSILYNNNNKYVWGYPFASLIRNPSTTLTVLLIPILILLRSVFIDSVSSVTIDIDVVSYYFELISLIRTLSDYGTNYGTGRVLYSSYYNAQSNQTINSMWYLALIGEGRSSTSVVISCYIIDLFRSFAIHRQTILTLIMIPTMIVILFLQVVIPTKLYNKFSSLNRYNNNNYCYCYCCYCTDTLIPTTTVATTAPPIATTAFKVMNTFWVHPPLSITTGEGYDVVSPIDAWSVTWWLLLCFCLQYRYVCRSIIFLFQSFSFFLSPIILFITQSSPTHVMFERSDHNLNTLNDSAGDDNNYDTSIVMLLWP